MAYWIVGRRRTRADAPRTVTWMQMGRVLKLPHKLVAIACASLLHRQYDQGISALMTLYCHHAMSQFLPL